MSFQWPEFLWLAAALPALVALYVYLLRRRKRFAVRYSSLALMREAMSGASWRRHVPPFLILLARAALIVAIARPSATIALPSQHETVILAMDVSGSMRASDVEPNRLVAAQTAAKAFIADQPDSVRIGIEEAAPPPIPMSKPGPPSCTSRLPSSAKPPSRKRRSSISRTA